MEEKMKEQFARTAMLLGEAGVERLERARVAVFGIGGVGGYVAEALARSGVGYFLLVDSDRVALSNLNRQIIATLETVGQYKTQAMKERILSIIRTRRWKRGNAFSFRKTRRNLILRGWIMW